MLDDLDITSLAEAVGALGRATSRTEVARIELAFAAAGSLQERDIVADVATITVCCLLAKEEARLDPLTGVYNRRGFFEAAETRARRAPGSAAVGLFDLDGLKAINDRRGHDAGSAALRAAAEAIQAAFPGAVVGRIGGDEFAAVIPDSADIAILRANLEATVRARSAMPDVRRLKVSAGFVTGEVCEAADVDDLLQAADKDLYDRRSRERGPTRKLRAVGRREAHEAPAAVAG